MVSRVGMHTRFLCRKHRIMFISQYSINLIAKAEFHFGTGLRQTPRSSPQFFPKTEQKGLRSEDGRLSRCDLH
jgi:hypothetical protein